MKKKIKEDFKYKNTNGIEYKIYWESIPPKEECYGYATPPTRKNQRVVLDKRMTEREKLEFVPHEIMHSYFFDIDEDAIKKCANTIGKYLYKIGFRLKKSKD